MTATKDPRHTKAERLLSGGRGPSVQEKEAMLEHILSGLPPSTADDTVPARAPWYQRFARPLALTASLGAVATVLLLIVVPSGRTPTDQDGEFGVRGAGDKDAVALDFACGADGQRVGGEWNDGALHCPKNGETTLRVDRKAPGYAVAAAVLYSDGTLMWVLPGAASPAPVMDVGETRYAFSLAASPSREARLLVAVHKGALSRTDARQRFEARLGEDHPDAGKSSDVRVLELLVTTTRKDQDAGSATGAGR